MENNLTEKAIEKGLRDSIIDGIYANLFGTLTGSIFLVSFALYIGANELQIGLIASLPLLANATQFLSSYIIEKTRKRKELSIRFSSIARGVWVINVLALLLYSRGEKPASLIPLVIVVLAVSHVFASLSAVSWLSWISDLVQENRLGRYFSTRNIICGLAGLVAAFLGGRFLDYWKITFKGDLDSGFVLIFSAALAFGFISLSYLKKVPEPPFARQEEKVPFFKIIHLPFKDANFKRFIFYTMFWSFSVHFVSPFFAVYMIQDLKLSYTLIAELIIVSTLADIFGMRVWGLLSDRFGNKPVILLNGYIAAFVPFLFIFATGNSITFLVMIHFVLGFAWAGLNLCKNNLLLRLSPKEYRPVYISYFNTVGGLVASLAPVIGGMAAVYVNQWRIEVFSLVIYRLHFIFFISFVMRILSINYFRKIKEPEEVPVSRMIRVIRNIRGFNTVMGFNHLHHLFIEVKNRLGNGNKRDVLEQPSPESSEEEKTF